MKIKTKRVVSYRSCDSRGEPVPSLPIQGKFLNQINFPVGAQVEVRYGGGFIHIARVLDSGRYDGLCAVTKH